MRTLIFCIFSLTVPLILSSQKGFQLGIGLNQLITNTETKNYLNEDKIHISNLYGASLNVDYSFSSKFKIKSGLEFKFQNIEFENFTNYRAEYVSIPLIFNYNFIQSEKSGFALGIDAGVSFDKPVFRSSEVTKISRLAGNNIENITTLKIDPSDIRSGVFEFNDYLSVRLGISAKYNLGKRGQLNFFAQSVHKGFENNLIYILSEIVLKNGNVNSNSTSYNYLKLANNGFQFGLYYTFGTLTFK